DPRGSGGRVRGEVVLEARRQRRELADGEPHGAEQIENLTVLQFPRASINVTSHCQRGGRVMRRIRSVASGGVLLAAAAAAVLAGTTSARSTAAGPIVIGYSADLVGQMSPFDTPALTAAQLEVKKINARGGVLGRKLEIKVCNTQNSKPD